MALVYFANRRYKIGSLVIGIGVLSHWLLDLIVHRPDLPLYPGSQKMLGFGLWNSIPATLIVEIILFIAGIGIYSRMTRPKDKIGQYGFWGFVGFLIVIYISNILGPPPPGVTSLAWVALLVWIFPFWAG